MHRIISIITGLAALLGFVIACVWQATDSRSMPAAVLAIMLCGVICNVIIAVNSWYAPAADREIGAALYAARERELHGVR